MKSNLEWFKMFTLLKLLLHNKQKSLLNTKQEISQKKKSDWIGGSGQDNVETGISHKAKKSLDSHSPEMPF